MSKNNILVIGSTGKLGSKLLSFCNKNNINIFGATSYKNDKKMRSQKNRYKIKNTFSLSKQIDYHLFISFISTHKFKIVYFLDYGSLSLIFLDILLKYNKNCFFAIANKEMIIAGGSLLTNNIVNSKNILIPLDSEHFSLYDKNYKSNSIKKIFITASGGPFYFNKKINLSKVSKSEVLAHPKWKMGLNNSIDSSNFINKILEIFELSSIYNIDINKISFLISREAFIHSVVINKDNTIHMNCFENDMLITLAKPLSYIYKLDNFYMNSKKIFNCNNFKLELFNDRRFKIWKKIVYFKKLPHFKQIQLMLLNNKAHLLYVQNKLKYNSIIDFIYDNLAFNNSKTDLSSFKKIINYIKILEKKYEKLT